MNLGSLEYAPGSRKDRKRLGRGNASGTGGTSGRGHKGYGSRSGSKSRGWMEGGTMPLYRRVPKRGFTNIFRKMYQVINIEKLKNYFPEGAEVTPEMLRKRNLIKKEQPVKILAKGEVNKPLKIKAHAFSRSSKEKIVKAGGSWEIIND